KLAELVAACAIAPVGSRSETDFSLCCYAIKTGIDKEQVWGNVEQVGKFAEQGRRYFDVTWENAEFEVRAGTYEKLLGKNSAKISEGTSADVEGGEHVGADAGDGANDCPTIHIDATTTPVGDTLRRITDCLVGAKDCFIRCEQLVVIHRDSITSILSPPEFA